MDQTFHAPDALDASSTQQLVQELKGCIRNVDHVAIAVPDLEAAIDWYTGKLGFRVVERRITRGKRTAMLSAVVIAAGVVVVLIQGTEPESQVSRFVTAFGPGVQHIAFGVEDLEHAMSRAIAAGAVADTPVIGDEGIRQVFLKRDSASGVRVELIERKGGEFTDKSVDRLFRAFEDNDLY